MVGLRNLKQTRPWRGWLTKCLFGILVLATLFSVNTMTNATGMDTKLVSATPTTVDDVEARLKELQLKLIFPSPSKALFKKVVVVDNMVYLSGHYFAF